MNLCEVPITAVEDRLCLSGFLSLRFCIEVIKYSETRMI